MVPGGPWPAAGSLSQKLPEIFQRATSIKRQAASRKRQAKRFDKKRFMYYIGYKLFISLQPGRAIQNLHRAQTQTERT